jgi:hemerythrin
MDTHIDVAGIAGLKENARQIALLNWATARLEQLSHRSATGDGIKDMLDCLAYFTREHFGYQERLLKEYSDQHAYLMDRMAVHAEFRHRLAQIYMDATRSDVTVADRLNALCHELWLDSQTQQETFAEIVSKAKKIPKIRRKTRPNSTPFHALLRFDS